MGKTQMLYEKQVPAMAFPNQVAWAMRQTTLQ